MATSTSSEVGARTSSGIRQRTCNRTACISPGPAYKCCDDNCLVEIARRDCKNEPNHRLRMNPNDAPEDSAVPLPADEEPCESHYLKAKAAYSEILNNIGCICKVLLSLNLESCCATPRAGSLRRQPSTISQTESLLAEVKRDSSDHSSTKPLKSAGCSNTCCTSGSSKVAGAETPPNINKDMPSQSSGTCKTGNTDFGKTDVGCSTKSCCAPPLASTAKAAVNLEATVDDINESLCCADSSAIIRFDPELETSAVKSTCSSGAGSCVKPGVVISTGHAVKTSECCEEKIDNCRSLNGLDSVFTPQNVESCHGKRCCSETGSKSAVGSEFPRDEQRALEICCSGSLQGTRPSTLGATGATEREFGFKETILNPKCALPKLEKGCCSSDSSKCLQEAQISPCTPINRAEQIDVEKGVIQVEHVVVSVQGMTCTGCEKALYKALTTVPTISNIKTSLLLGQTEFDLLRSSTSTNVVEAIKTIEKITGFTCTKMTQSGHELDLVVEGLALDFTEKDLPFGVSDIALVTRNTIRVTYHPTLIGARDLIDDPFFESAKLAPMADRPLIASGKAHLRLMLFKTILCALLTIPVLVMAWAQLPPHEIYYGAASLVLATIVQVYIAGPWYLSAFKALFFSHLIEMDLLVVLSTTTAYVYSIIAYAFLASAKPLSTGSFFETSTLLVTLIMVGRLVTSFARQRAVESISIESLQPSTAVLTDSKTGHREEIDVRLLQYGDIFTVLPDMSIATDGTVIAGISEVDESMITGEATLVTKSPASPVIAGSINHSGILTIRLSRLPGDNTIKAISLMVDEAKSSKTKIQDIADRVATYFIPTILVITMLVFIVWVSVGKAIRRYDSTTACINAMTYAISALIVSCPCAIGLAVPMVLVISGGVAAKHGLIFKTAETIEIARNISHVIFDKTGTLTQGLLAVDTEVYPTGEGNTLAPMLLGLTSNSKHPVSIAIASHLKSSGVQADKVDNLNSVAGCGIEATWGEDVIRAGNPHWLGVENLPAVKRILSLGVSVFCVTVNKGLVAVYGLKDRLRLDTMVVIDELKRRNIEISIVSGDNEESVKSIARKLDVPNTHVRFRCSPADKQAYVKKVSTGKSVVMFCGDGTNDAVALAQASIGMHVDGGTDIAQSAADAVLIRPALSGIIILIDLSKAFFRRVVFNFVWSFVYNTFAILLAAGAFPNARIPPEFAGLGEIVSVLPVIAVGMQLKWIKFSKVGA